MNKLNTVKVVTILNSYNVKVIFIVFMSKMYIYQYLNTNSKNPFFEKFHLLKKSLTKLKKLKSRRKNKSHEMERVLMSLLPVKSQRQIFLTLSLNQNL